MGSLEGTNIVNTFPTRISFPFLKAVVAEVLFLALGATNSPSCKFINVNDFFAVGTNFGVLVDPVLVQLVIKICNLPAAVPTDENDLSFSEKLGTCLLYTSPSPRDQRGSRMPSSA